MPVRRVPNCRRRVRADWAEETARGMAPWGIRASHRDTLVVKGLESNALDTRGLADHRSAVLPVVDTNHGAQKSAGETQAWGKNAAATALATFERRKRQRGLAQR